MADITKINLKGTLLTIKDQYAYHNGDLATVATSGSYNDLSDKPVIPPAVDLTGYATETYVDTTVANLVDSAPQTLDTLKELADALGDDPNFATTMATQLGNKVDKVSGMGLSTNDYTDAEKTKLGGIETGAEVNVQADWNETNTSSDAYIANKPTIPAAQVQTDWNASSGMGVILNKPNLASVATSGSYADLSNKPTIPTVDTTITQNSTNATQSGAVYTALAGKQDTLTFDTTPTANSTKPVTSGGIKTYVDGKATITGITTSQDGTFTIALSDGNSYTVNLNHVHPQYTAKKTVESITDATVTLSADVIYNLGTVAGNKTINLPTTVDQAADYEFRLSYTSGTISGTAISGTTVANDATLTFTAGKTYQVIISGGILYFSETTVSA